MFRRDVSSWWTNVHASRCRISTSKEFLNVRNFFKTLIFKSISILCSRLIKKSTIFSLFFFSFLFVVTLHIFSSLVFFFSYFRKIFCDFCLSDNDSSQSFTSYLLSDFRYDSFFDRKESCICTRLLQSTIQESEQEALNYESLRKLYRITYKSNEKFMKKVRRISLSSCFVNLYTYHRIFLNIAK